MSSLEERVANLIANELKVDVNKVTEKADFVNDLGCDSLDTVELVMKVEEEFGITITDMDAEKTHTVGDLIKLIKEKSE